MITLILIGFIAGIVSGMGIGGGTILIPALTLIIALPQKTAQGINLLYFIPTATVALCAHIKAKRIRKDLLIGLIIGGIAGAVIGSLLANALEPEYLRKGFGVFLLVMGLSEIFKKASNQSKEKKQ
ncbi:sulfite exporter TauE/SafE family protein [Vallitalea okinawensis]|uniref:sulfite exporter TauE/SafE family protein n=1 Tax=Vallitalea okinawensis TaxID=2078660 RepID=UPI002E8E3B70|nr:sulfite exporter TauE/SafE family protein [Vallitalea okinawensis]